MAVTLLPKHLELIRNIAENEGIKNYELETRSGSQKGEGYMSHIVLVFIKSPEKTLKLLLKIASNSTKLRTQTPVGKAFRREIFIYKDVFKHYDNLQKKSGMTFIPTKFYGYTLDEYEECLALENLKEEGFQLWDRKIPLNHEHLDLTFQAYGELHALSFVTRYLYPNKYKEWLESTNNIRKDLITENLGRQLTKLLGTFVDLFDEEEIKEKFDKFRTGWLDVYISEGEEKYSVLTHGDPWCNNFLYKYDNSANNTKPTEIRLLDFQIARFSTPVHDLSFCLFTVTDKEYFSRYSEYLKIYHNTMADVLRKYKLDIEIVYPYKILEQQWEEYAKYGLLMAIILLKNVLVSDEDAVDTSELAENNCDIMEYFLEPATASEEFYSRVKDLIQFFVDRNLI